jgi:hypothetical protein
MAASESAMEGIWLKKFVTKLGVVPSALDPHGDLSVATIVHSTSQRDKISSEVQAYQASISPDSL